MRKASFFLFAALAAVMSVSCNPDEKKPQTGATEFKPLSETTINVDKSGGEVIFKYEVVNPTEAAVEATLQDGVDWITDLNAHSVYGEVSFHVAVNEQESTREAEIHLAYGDLSIDLTVIQGEGEYIEPFQINIKEVDYMAVTWDVIAKDQEMPYINMIVDKATWDSFASFDEYFDYSLDRISESAAGAGLTLEDYIEQSLLIYGDTLDVSTKGLLPATEYIIYAIGLTPEQEKLSEVCWESFTTGEIPTVDVDFTIVCETSPTSVVISVTPDDDEVYYMFSFVDGSGHNPDDVRDSYQLYVNGLIEEFREYGLNMPIEQIILGIASHGPDTYNSEEYGEELTPSTTYTAFAVAVDLYTGIFNSEAALKEFTTDEMPQGEWESTLTSDYELDLSGAVGTVQYKSDYYRNGYDNWIVSIKSADGVSGDEIKLDFMAEAGSLEAGIPTGTYNVMSTSPDYLDPVAGDVLPGEYFYGYLYTWYKGDFDADGKPQSVAPAKGGTLNVTNHGDGTYTFEFSFVDDSPLQNEFSGSWTGSLTVS